MSISPSTTTDAPIIPAWSLGDRLRKVRRMLGMSQIELAEQLGTNAKTYAAWELDSTAPRNLLAIAKRIEVLSSVPAIWILGLEQPGAVTRVDTGEYPAAQSGLATVVPLFRGTPSSYHHVSSGNGSSICPNDYASNRALNHSSGVVNDANTA